MHAKVKIVKIGNKNRVCSFVNPEYALDCSTARSSKNNAQLYKTSESVDEDQLVRFENHGHYYKIKLAYSDLYLTAANDDTPVASKITKATLATANSNVYWAAPIGSSKQKWDLEKVEDDNSDDPEVSDSIIAPPNSINSVNILQRYNAPLSFTGSTITIKNVENNNSKEEYYHRGSGFKPSENGKNFLDTANGAQVLSIVRNFAKTVFKQPSLPSRERCAYYLFGEYDYNAKFHHGVDMQIGDGLPIYPFWGGKVVAVGGEYGKVSIYVESLGVTTVYLHMKNIPPYVYVGATITEDNKIGEQSNVSHDHIKSHLHFEVRKGKNVYAGDNSASSSTKALTSIIPYGFMRK